MIREEGASISSCSIYIYDDRSFDADDGYEAAFSRDCVMALRSLPRQLISADGRCGPSACLLFRLSMTKAGFIQPPTSGVEV